MKKTKDILGPPPPNSIVEGEIIDKEDRGLIVDLKYLGMGIVFKGEIKDMAKYKIGQKIKAKWLGFETEDGLKELSLKNIGEEKIWEKLKEKKEKDEILLGKVIGANKGGLLVNVLGKVGFLPTSQLLPVHYPIAKKRTKEEIVSQLQKLIGKKIKVKIFHLSKGGRKLILTEKYERAF